MPRLPGGGERYGGQRLVSLVASMTQLPGLAAPAHPPLTAALRERYAEDDLTDRSAAQISGVNHGTLNFIYRGVPHTWRFKAQTIDGLSRLLRISPDEVRRLATLSEQSTAVQPRAGDLSAVEGLTGANTRAVATLASHLLATQQTEEELSLAVRNLVQILLRAIDDPAVAQEAGRVIRAAMSMEEVPEHINGLPRRTVSRLSRALSDAGA